MKRADLFFISLSLVMFIFSAPYFISFYEIDETMFIFGGVKSLEGWKLYHDFIENKPPLLFLLDAIIYKTIPLWATRVLMFLLINLSIYGLYRLIIKKYSELHAISSISLIMLLLSAPGMATLSLRADSWALILLTSSIVLVANKKITYGAILLSILPYLKITYFMFLIPFIFYEKKLLKPLIILSLLLFILNFSFTDFKEFIYANYHYTKIYLEAAKYRFIPLYQRLIITGIIFLISKIVFKEKNRITELFKDLFIIGGFGGVLFSVFSHMLYMAILPPIIISSIPFIIIKGKELSRKIFNRHSHQDEIIASILLILLINTNVYITKNYLKSYNEKLFRGVECYGCITLQDYMIIKKIISREKDVAVIDSATSLNLIKNDAPKSPNSGELLIINKGEQFPSLPIMYQKYPDYWDKYFYSQVKDAKYVVMSKCAKNLKISFFCNQGTPIKSEKVVKYLNYNYEQYLEGDYIRIMKKKS